MTRSAPKGVVGLTALKIDALCVVVESSEIFGRSVVVEVVDEVMKCEVVAVNGKLRLFANTHHGAKQNRDQLFKNAEFWAFHTPSHFAIKTNSNKIHTLNFIHTKKQNAHSYRGINSNINCTFGLD